MAWTDLIDEQFVSHADLQDAVDTGVFTLQAGQTIPSTQPNRFITCGDVPIWLNAIINQGTWPYTVTNNEWPQKSWIVSAGPTCPPGYTLSPDGTYCYLEETQAPTIESSGICLAESNLSPEYGTNGTRVYATTSDYNGILAGTFTTLITDYWRGNPAGSGETVNGGNPPGSATPVPGTPASPMNRDGVWVDTDCDGIKDGLTSGSILQFSYLIDTPTPKTVFIGIAGDNTFRVDVNNATIVNVGTSPGTIAGGGSNSQDNFTFWYVFPIDLVAGPNYINFQAIGDGSVNDGFAATIMDNTYAEIIAATQDSDLTYLFRTSTFEGTTIDIATCPAGWTLDTSGGVGNYVCRRITTTPPTP